MSPETPADVVCQDCGGSVNIEAPFDTDHSRRPGQLHYDARKPVELHLECQDCGLAGRLADSDFTKHKEGESLL